MAAKDISAYSDGEWHSLNTAISNPTLTYGSDAIPAGTTITSKSVPGYSISTTSTTSSTTIGSVSITSGGYPAVWTGTTATPIYVDPYPTPSYSVKDHKLDKKAEAELAKKDEQIENLEERLRLMERQVRMAQYDADVARIEADEYDRMILASAKDMDAESMRGAQKIRDHIDKVVSKYVETHPLPEDVDTTD